MERGRPKKLTEETIKTIADSLYIGMSREKASVYAGITYQCFITWIHQAEGIIERGEEKQKKSLLYVIFLTEVRKAEAEAIAKWQQVIDKAAERDPVWAKFMLQVRDKANYQVQQAIDLTSGNEVIKPVVNIYMPSNGRESDGNPGGSN